MSVEVDELFSGGAAPPPPPDPTRRLLALAAGAAGVNLLALVAGAGAFVLSGAAALYAELAAGAMPVFGGEAIDRVVWACLFVYLLLVPSVVASLYLWHRAGEEMDRVRSGALPRAYFVGLRRLRRALFGWLGGQVVSMAIQAWFIGRLMLAATGPMG